MSVDCAGSGRQSMRGAQGLRHEAPSATAARVQLKVNVLGSVLLASGAVALAQAPQPAVATGQAATDTEQGAGRNLTNQAVPMFMSEANNPGGYDEEIDLPPRTYGLRVEYTF